MKKLSIIICLLLSVWAVNDLQAQDTTLMVDQTAEAVELEWVEITDLEARMAEEPRPVMIDLYTDWCGWCKRMDKNTFQHPDIAKYLGEKFYVVKFDAETKDTVRFMNYDFEFIDHGRKGFNRLAYLLINGNQPNGRMGYPTVAFLSKNLKRINAFPGYKSPPAFDAILRYVSEEHYQTKSFPQFSATYTSPIPEPEDPRKAAATSGKKRIVPPTTTKIIKN